MNPIGLPQVASWNIQGQLPFGQARGNPAAAVQGAGTGNVSSIVADYTGAYNNALAMNMANYNNILSGYQQAIASQTSAQQAIQSGYNDLYNSVMGKLEGQGIANQKRINDAAEQFLARQTQSQVDRGLGNTTITTSTARGTEADRQSRLQEDSEGVARMMADYMSNIGGQRLQNQQRGVENTTGLALNQLGFMNSVQAKYPDAGMYAQLAQMAAEERNRGDGAGGGEFGGGAFGGARQGGPGPKLGYVPGPGPYYGGGGYSPPISTGGGGGSWLAQQSAVGGGAGALDSYYGGGMAAAPAYGGYADSTGLSGYGDFGGAYTGDFSDPGILDYGGGGDF